MVNILSNVRRKGCLKMIDSLLNLKTLSRTPEEFAKKLEDVHCSFLSLKNLMQIKELKTFSLELLKQEQSVYYYKVGECELIAEKGRIIAFKSNNSELERLFINRSIEDAKEMAEMYYDFEYRNCDYCGQYFLKPSLEVPMGRTKEKDYVSAYHHTCKDNSTN